MKKHIKFTDIPQFRDVIRNVTHQSQFKGFNDNNEPIMDLNDKKPILEFKGTVKLHGTNAGICSNKDEDEIWYQGRKRIVTITKDNAGFASFCEARKDSIKILMNQAKSIVKEKDCMISIYGEFCGEGIQKGVSINQLPKMFVIFALKVSPYDTEKSAYYLDSSSLNEDRDNKIYNINMFPTFKINIDFNNPGEAQNKIVELVNEVEKECPVGKALGVKEGITIGEGIVWEGYYNENRHVFKTKGQKHSISKTKTIAPVDVEKLNSINEFVNYAVTENRMKQALNEVFEDGDYVITKMGDFLKWINKDIIKEESDVLTENDLSVKDVNRSISKKARLWFQEILNKQAGL